MSHSNGSTAVPALRTSDPQPDKQPAEVELNRPTEQDWTAQGAVRWMQELVKSDASEPRFSREEAFLTGLFSALPSARVLDFGRGFGGRLGTLHALGHHELHGCDTSTRQNHHIPFDEAFFDVSLTSDVLVHIEPPDILAVLRELWRVSTSLIVHIEHQARHEPESASATPQRRG
ncbi:MAG TPA: class I SAM-dependent methyltransferase, partial [Archangium sp.]|nr:class I SAM-dependent methyltransferase [Archangium sp.]